MDLFGNLSGVVGFFDFGFGGGGVKGFLLNFAVFVFSLFVVVRSADMLVDGAVSFARRVGVSDFVIGLSLIAFGTSLPEFAVSFFAALKGKSSVSIGNVVGSNIVNILFGLGLASLIRPLSARRNFVIREIPINFLITFALFFLMNDLSRIFSPSPENISRSESLTLLLIFIFYIYLLRIMAEEEKIVSGDEIESEFKEIERNVIPVRKTIIFILGGLAGLFLGGNFAVDSASSLVRIIGLSETFAGTFFIAVGTSLPEIVTSATASFKKNSDIAMGNIAGSNIFNLAFVIGLAGVISPLEVPKTINFHMLFLFIANFLVLLSMFFGRKRMITRSEGAFYLVIYFTYLYLSVVVERV